MDIVGIGNASVDLTTNLPACSPLNDIIGVNKGGYWPTEDAEFETFLGRLRDVYRSAGGSVANSIRAAAVLGAKTAFIGQIGNDNLGRFFLKNLIDYQITPMLNVRTDQKNACFVVLRHEDHEKTVCGNLRAARNIHIDCSALNLIQSSKLLFVEAYLLNHSAEAVEQALAAAGEQNVCRVLTLSDPKVVKRHSSFLESHRGQIDILIGNEAEYAALPLGYETPLMVQMKGKNGVEILRESEKLVFPALKIEIIVNTNGAGDAFAGGFLYSWLKEKDLPKAVECGQECALKVLASESGHLRHNDPLILRKFKER